MIFKRNPNRKNWSHHVSHNLRVQQQDITEHEHLIITYNQMLIDMECILSQAPSSHTPLQNALKCSQKKAVESGIVNKEEAHEIASCIKMDVNDVADSMMESSAECYDWLMLDIESIELKVLEKYLAAAKKTREIIESLKR